MPRAVWTGSITFGLVNIPVRLFPATEPKDVRFHLTDSRGRRVRYRRFVEDADDAAAGWTRPLGPPTLEPETGITPGVEADAPSAAESPHVEHADTATPAVRGGEEIAYEDLMRGFETDDGRLVVLGREDLEAVRPERSRTIEIEDFVALADIDPVYFEKSYHLAPQHGAERAYVLLLRAVEDAGRVGIGRFVLRTKPHLVAIRPVGRVLGLETMFFADEVRDGRELVPGLDGVEVSDRELKLADSLIKTLETTWNAAAYSDTYREELLRRIAQKSPIELPDEVGTAVTASGARVEELMQALKASVEAAKKSRPKAKRASSRKRTA